MDEFQIITGLQLDPVIATRYEIETALDGMEVLLLCSVT